MTTVKMPVALAAVFVWIGFVCAISFMEAWLKFRAPGITLPLGLGIGRIVFSALNRVEWVLAFAVVCHMLVSKELKTGKSFFIIPVLVLLIMQTFWLLPALDTRAQMHIDGLPVAASNLHFIYVATEVIKVSALSVFGISLFKSETN